MPGYRGPQPYQFGDTMDRFDQSYARTRGFQEEAAVRKVGNALKNGDYQGAVSTLYDNGLVTEAQRLEDRLSGQRATAANAKKTQADQAAQFMADSASRLRQLYDAEPDQTKRPARVLAGFDQLVGRFRELGETDEEIAQARKQLEADPETTLTMLGAGAAKEMGLEIVKGADGSYVAVDTKTGRPRYKFRAPRTMTAQPGASVLEIPGEEGGEGASQPITAEPPEPPAQPAPTANSVRSIVDGLVRNGARITSSQRTPQHNAEVGGAPNSYHLRGQAFDIVPPPGMSMAQLETQLRGTGVKFAELINEGDHVHVAWANEGQPKPAQASPGGPRVIYTAPEKAKETARPATAAEKAAYGIGPEVPAQMLPSGQIQIITGTGAANKRVPAPIQKGYIENSAAVAQIDRAIAAVKAHPKSMGLMNIMGDEIRQRADPDGIKTRASVAEVGAVKIHDLSGAAVTAAETPRLKPFIPMPTDNADATVKKLEQLKEQLLSNNSQIETQYGEESGYMPLAKAKSAPALRKDPAAIRDAQIAIRRGAPKDKVIARLRDNGIDPAGL